MSALSILWFRRDLRLADHPALAEAAGRGTVIALFVLDPRLLAPAGAPRVAFLFRCLRALDESIGGRLVVRVGDPADVVPAVAAETEADRVYASWDAGPYGSKRDERVAEALHAGGRSLSLLGSPYAVDPGSVHNRDGQPFRVFSPFYGAWTAHGWAQPLTESLNATWIEGPTSDPIPEEPPLDATLPPAGEAAAMAHLDAFLQTAADYAAQRDVPAADATSRLSPYLKYGCIHPRQVLARLGRSEAHEKFRTELAWREFYADVLWHVPESARRSLQRAMSRMRLDSGRVADERFTAWTEGRTGFPMVDAGMRQLQGEAWVHNRVRMIVASFLVKDLHIDWTRGARWFMGNLVDGDLASNNHNWQWVAGTGTDPAPYFRIFNPVAQGKKHDPDGDYVRRWVPELAGVPGVAVHEPWKLPDGVPGGYPAPIVDHATERADALARFSALKSAR
ncbi:MAG TPA: deoxyribodipyrimidine photo-lyase [Acidimicrobiales bacterium]|nr:deoxyribodipyrimidine photo-lyase [Acidimicrobiales bacterium]